MWRRLIFDRGCFSEGVVVKCSAIYTGVRSTVQPDCYALLYCDLNGVDCGLMTVSREQVVSCQEQCEN
jgi:hypothetical protein